MSICFCALVNRRVLLEVLNGSQPQKLRPVGQLSEIRPPTGEDVVLFWDQDPNLERYLPVVMAVNGDQLDNFLAWASTYLQGFTPFTAFFQVLSWSMLLAGEHEHSMPTFGNYASACVGAIIGESLTRQHAMAVETLHWRSLTTTLSFSLARAFATGTLLRHFEIVADKWLQASKFCEIQMHPLHYGFIEVWRTLTAMRFRTMSSEGSEEDVESRLAVVDACLEIHTGGELSNSTFADLSGGHKLLIEAYSDMRGTREERVVIFRRIIQQNLLGTLTSVRQDFLCGYLANCIGPGSLSHSPVIPVSDEFPLAMLWYCVCAGLRPDNNLLQSYGCLGRRLIRDASMQEAVISSPRCDIALEEFGVFANSETANWSFRRTSQMFLAVQLWPRVPAYMNWQRKGMAPARSQLPLFEADAKATEQSYAEEALRLINRAAELLIKNQVKPNQRKGRRGSDRRND